MEELSSFDFGTAVFNQIEEDVVASPLGWQFSEGKLYCSPFDVARVVYFMFTELVRVTAFDQHLVVSVLRSCHPDFVFRVVACTRQMCDHLRTQAPHGSRVARIEVDIKSWIYSASRLATV
tara:strand:+ start:659 stop:1021 length:363 start_codon:yes stop_codon:yes gene_type:complete